MGGIHRIKKQLKGKPLIMADTSVVFNGRKVLLAVNNPQEAQGLAKQFAEFMAFLNFRAKQINMGDIMAGQKEILSRIEDGRSILN